MPKAKKAKTPVSGARAEPGEGDAVRVICSDGEYEGIFLPRSSEETPFVKIKLSSGYNIGIARERIKKIEVITPAQPRQVFGKPKPAQAAACFDPAKPFSSILACGGTIASRIDYGTGAVYPATTPEELLANFPSACKMNVRAKTLFSLLSEDISPAHWEKIASAAAAEIRDGAQGVVVTHGTDTMSYTSSALSFMLQNLPCPVVMVGSQRSSDRGSSDAEINMHSALVASRADLSGVFVCMHEGMSDDSCLLHFGTKVRKMHTTRRDAFRSIDTFPAARIIPATEKVEKLSARCAPKNAGAKLLLDTKMNTNVALIYAYPGIKPELISSLSKYDGVVFAGTGLGHLPINRANEKDGISVLPQVKEIISSGIPVVVTSQAIYGRVDMDVYANGRILREAGAIGHLCDFTPEAAYVKLMWVLAREKKMEKVKALMEKNIAGEITERSEFSGY